MDSEALVKLGLSGDPGSGEIRKAYLARTTQPRFQDVIVQDLSLSQEFSRLHEAYITLMRELAQTGVEVSAPSSTSDTVQLLYNQGVYAMIHQNFLRAGEKFQEADRIQPRNPLVLLHLGILLLKRHSFYAAEKYLRDAAELLPDNHAPWLYLAETYEQAGKPGAAQAALRRALALNPSLSGIAARIKTLDKKGKSGKDSNDRRLSLLERLLGRRR
ncbi:MAG TPA: tetratricopeptide repeat protein [Candidatus Aminicenantes bacterium]|nr:tetratricopeptide repeat protein [Candidatus Aminicenantes bacterium]